MPTNASPSRSSYPPVLGALPVVQEGEWTWYDVRLLLNDQRARLCHIEIRKMPSGNQGLVFIANAGPQDNPGDVEEAALPQYLTLDSQNKAVSIPFPARQKARGFWLFSESDEVDLEAAVFYELDLPAEPVVGGG
jgi:hypothetical protein